MGPKLRNQLITAMVVLSFIGPASSEYFPKPVVCQEMAARGVSLLEGDPSGFFFVDALDGEFPIPTFFEVIGADATSGNRIRLEANPYLSPRTGLPAIRNKSNHCDWVMIVAFGPKKTLFERSMKEELIVSSAINNYSLGNLSVYVVPHDGLGEMHSIVAWNDERYISLTSESPDNALWLLHLFSER